MRNAVRGSKVTWLDIQNPSEEDVEFLRENYSLHPLILKEIVPPSWMPEVQVFPSYLFVVLHYPAYSKESRETRPRELDLILTRDALVTSHYSSILPLKAFFDRLNLYEEARESFMAQGPGVLLAHILERLLDDCMVKLSRINAKLTAIEDNIFEGQESKTVKEISLARTDVLNFARIIAPQERTFDSLLQAAPSFFGEELRHYYSRLQNAYGRCRETVETYKETVGALEETNNSLLNRKINEIIKALTLFSVVVFPLTLIAAIFGMNTRYLPVVGHPSDFWIISGAMAAGTVTMVAFFRYKRWL